MRWISLLFFVACTESQWPSQPQAVDLTWDIRAGASGSGVLTLENEHSYGQFAQLTSTRVELSYRVTESAEYGATIAVNYDSVYQRRSKNGKPVRLSSLFDAKVIITTGPTGGIKTMSISPERELPSSLKQDMHSTVNSMYFVVPTLPRVPVRPSAQWTQHYDTNLSGQPLSRKLTYILRQQKANETTLGLRCVWRMRENSVWQDFRGNGTGVMHVRAGQPFAAMSIVRKSSAKNRSREYTSTLHLTYTPRP